MQAKESKKTKRIKQISVKKLFGMFDHTISLNMDERITIIHGPNGFGKTAILKLTNALFCRNIRILRTTPFSELYIEFCDDANLWVTKATQNTSDYNIVEERPSISQNITFHATNEESFSLPSTPIISQDTLNFIENRMPSLDHLRPNLWKHATSGEILTDEDIIERFGDRFPLEIAQEKEPSWLTSIRNSIPVRFIETQRLLNAKMPTRRIEYEMHRTMGPTVTLYADEIAKIIQRKLAESSTLNQSLDKAFPLKVFDPTSAQRIVSDSGIREKLEKLNQKRSQLTDIGLLDEDNKPFFQVGDQIDDSKRVMLSVYIEDTEQKLGIFDELAAKIELLTTIINKRFLYKKMTTNKERGFVFTTSNGTILPLESLSSGEQHELVLFYELLFKVASGSLILIDEPELSLHVVWQMEFLKDLQEITQLAELDVLMATHSPDIISDRWDLTVKLEAPVQ